MGTLAAFRALLNAAAAKSSATAASIESGGASVAHTPLLLNGHHAAPSPPPSPMRTATLRVCFGAPAALAAAAERCARDAAAAGSSAALYGVGQGGLAASLQRSRGSLARLPTAPTEGDDAALLVLKVAQTGGGAWRGEFPLLLRRVAAGSGGAPTPPPSGSGNNSSTTLGGMNSPSGRGAAVGAASSSAPPFPRGSGGSSIVAVAARGPPVASFLATGSLCLPEGVDAVRALIAPYADGYHVSLAHTPIMVVGVPSGESGVAASASTITAARGRTAPGAIVDTTVAGSGGGGSGGSDPACAVMGRSGYVRVDVRCAFEQRFPQQQQRFPQQQQALIEPVTNAMGDTGAGTYTTRWSSSSASSPIPLLTPKKRCSTSSGTPFSPASTILGGVDGCGGKRAGSAPTSPISISGMSDGDLSYCSTDSCEEEEEQAVTRLSQRVMVTSAPAPRAAPVTLTSTSFILPDGAAALAWGAPTLSVTVDGQTALVCEVRGSRHGSGLI